MAAAYFSRMRISLRMRMVAYGYVSRMGMYHSNTNFSSTMNQVKSVSRG
jgi:hypothetical protein